MTGYQNRLLTVSATALQLAIVDQERERVEKKLQFTQREVQRLLQEAIELQQKLANLNQVLRDREVAL